jgi:hypothetical protein
MKINPPLRDYQRRAAAMDAANELREQTVIDEALDDVKNRIEISAKSLQAHFTEDMEATDVQVVEDVEAPDADTLEAAKTGAIL